MVSVFLVLDLFPTDRAFLRLFPGHFHLVLQNSQRWGVSGILLPSRESLGRVETFEIHYGFAEVSNTSGSQRPDGLKFPFYVSDDTKCAIPQEGLQDSNVGNRVLQRYAGIETDSGCPCKALAKGFIQTILNRSLENAIEPDISSV